MLIGKQIPIFILDLDETIIGDISPQLEENNIINYLYIKGKPLQYKLYKESVLYDLKHNFIVRPFFSKFIECCKTKKYPVFIYSASTKIWLKFIIELIEKSLNFKFERPLFSRDNLNKIELNNKYGNKYTEFFKSIDKIKPKIYKSLKKKHNNLVMYNEFNNIIMIDNRIDLIIDRKKYKIIECPAYNYIHIIDPLRNLTEEQKYINCNKISKVLFRKVLINYRSLIKNNYKKYLEDFTSKKIKESNKYFKKDRFWLDLLNQNKNIFG